MLTVLSRLKSEVRCLFSVVGGSNHEGVSLQEKALLDDGVGGVEGYP